jgi:hypothetical protein
MGDWTAQGNDTIGVVRAANGNLNWYLRNSNSSGPADIGPFVYGWATDIPVVGHWAGSSVTGIGVVRPQNGGLTWYLRNTPSPGNPDITPFNYGVSSDVPKVGDWTGNCSTTIGVARPSVSTGAGTWYLRNSNSAGNPDITPFGYGLSTDAYLVGNWNAQFNRQTFCVIYTIGVGR